MAECSELVSKPCFNNPNLIRLPGPLVCVRTGSLSFNTWLDMETQNLTMFR